MEICASLGGGLTQIGMGYLLSQQGFIPPTIFITCCSIIGLLFTIFLRDSRKTDHAVSMKGNVQLDEDIALAETESPKQKDGNSKGSTSGVVKMFGQIREVFRIYTSNSVKCGICDKEGTDCEHCDPRSRRRVWRLWLYLVTYVMYMAAVDGIELFITMFLVSFPICFTPTQVGIQTGLEYVISIFAPLLIVLFSSLMHFGNQTIILVAISGRIVSSLIMFLAKSAEAIYIGTTVDVFGHLTTPFIRVQISNLVSPTEQGPGLALVPSVAKLVNIPIQAIILTIYPATLHIGHSFIWVVMGCFFSVAFILMLIVWIADKFGQKDVSVHVVKQETCNSKD